VALCLGGILYIFAGDAFAQQVWVRAYETEEDLWESYWEGEITSEQYFRLLALFRSGADSVFQPLSDLEELPGYSALDTAGAVSRRPAFAGRPELRWGYALPLREGTDEEGYFVGRWQAERARVFFDGRSRRGKPDGLRKRGITLTFAGSRGRLTLGNYEPRYGLGLIAGRRDRVLGRTQDTRLSGSIWQPMSANYNGIHLGLDIGPAVRLSSFGSRIESSQYREDMTGAHVALAGIGGWLETGLTGVASRISDPVADRIFSRHGVGAYLSGKENQREIATEVAMADGGAIAAAVRAVRSLGSARLVVTLWSYDPGFVLFTSGGPSHPRRQPIRIFEDDLRYYSRTAGEQGLLIKQRTPVNSRAVFESTLQLYNDRLENTKNIEGKLACRISLPQSTSISAYLRGRDKIGANLDEDRMYYGIHGRTRLVSRFPVKWRAEYGRINRVSVGSVNSLRLEFQTTAEFNGSIRVTPRLRYVDPDLSVSEDGYYYLYVTEKITPFDNCDIELVVAVKGFEHSAKQRYADVRVRSTWRP
jgi:hypothetical protein